MLIFGARLNGKVWVSIACLRKHCKVYAETFCSTAAVLGVYQLRKGRTRSTHAPVAWRRSQVEHRSKGRMWLDLWPYAMGGVAAASGGTLTVRIGPEAVHRDRLTWVDGVGQ